MVQARQLLHKLIQSEAHRRALIYQKRYLEMVIGQRDNTMTSSSRPVSGRRRFRVAVVVVCFIFRLTVLQYYCSVSILLLQKGQRLLTGQRAPPISGGRDL